MPKLRAGLEPLSSAPLPRLTRVDLGVALVAILLTALDQPHLFTPGTLVSLDTATQYYPWYAYLGQSLRAGHIPGWNPSTFSGTPFAANPLSGWTYAPAMLVFSALPIASAIGVYLLVHPCLAAASAFALARVLGLSRLGALVASVAYANSSFNQVQNLSSSPFASVYAWLPVAILGAELAMRSQRWSAQFAAWTLAAVAISQIIAVWPGQGAYYAALLIGAYIAYRCLLALPDRVSGTPQRRIGHLLLHAGMVFAMAAALSAAGILPRLEFNGLSNLAGGYTGAEAKVGGLHPKDWLLVAVPGFWYVGGSVLALAIAAPFLDRGHFNAPIRFFGLTSLGALLISGTAETPLHWMLYHLLPGFARLHPHAPERILTVAYLGPALLAGMAFTALQARTRSGRSIRLSPRQATTASGLAVMLVVIDLALGGAKARSDVMLRDPANGADKLALVDLATYFQPDPAAVFLGRQLETDASRFIGYAPYLNGKAWPYSTRFMDPETAALEVNNRALPLGLQDAQGYDASHLDRYDMYLAALNGRTQNYHDAEVFWAGLASPLLDLLNVRYVIVPPSDHLDMSDRAAVQRFASIVFADARVRILENHSAFPRAWLVHAAMRMGPAEALAAIDSGRLQARVTALLEEPPPTLAPPGNPAADSASIAQREAERVVVTTSSETASMLVMSDVYYPAWNAYVDGHPAHLYVADGALRAVAVPAGRHSVELRYESAMLAVGTAISVGTLGVVALVLVVGLLRRYTLPDDQARFRLTNAHGARDSGRDSIA